MAFFDKLNKFLEKAEKFVDDNFEDTKTSYSEETLIRLCKNDRRILYDDMLRKAKMISSSTVKFDWGFESEGTSTIKKVSDLVYSVTINGSVYGLDDFGNFTDRFIYTKTIFIDKYGDLNNSVGTNNVIIKKKI